MSTVTFPWQHNGLQALSIQRGKIRLSKKRVFHTAHSRVSRGLKGRVNEWQCTTIRVLRNRSRVVENLTRLEKKIAQVGQRLISEMKFDNLILAAN